jgi:Reverse transcriptase (RNA-dependent DNA polymerase)
MGQISSSTYFCYFRVYWDFLIEIFYGRNFRERWITWIKNILHSGRTCININGHLGEYFSCRRGVWQNDPLSPFLFDIVSEAFHRILSNASNEGYLKGVQLGRNNLKFLNLHFADDTLLFLEASESNIQVLRWLSIGFENLSRLKINYSKREIISMNIFEDEGNNLASLFGCNVGTLPISYMGVPLYWKKLSVSDWNFFIDKIEKKL